MAIKNYRGNSQKNIWENGTFRKGMNYTEESNREGVVKSLVNLDISPSGSRLKPRSPFYSSLFKLSHGTTPISFGKNTFLFDPKQNKEKEFFISVGALNQTKKPQVIYDGDSDTTLNNIGIEVIDGDTFKYNGESFRLLGIDTPELGDALNSVRQNAITAKEQLISYLTPSPNPTDPHKIEVKLDKNTDSDLDIYGRTLAWLYVNDICINVELLRTGWARIYGEYDTIFGQVHMVELDLFSVDDLVAYRQEALNGSLGIWGSEPYEPQNYGAPKSILAVEGKPNLTIHSKERGTPLQAYQEYPTSLKLPIIEVENESNRIDFSPVYKDLELEVGENIEIEVLEEIKQKNKASTVDYKRISPTTVAEDQDIFVFIGRIQSDGVEIYRGPISVKYYVPLRGNIPQFQAYRFVVDTYKNNIYQIKYEDLDSYSMNLLDKEIDELQSLYGKDAEDAGYSDGVLRDVVILNSRGKRVEKVKAGNSYTIQPIVALPEIANKTAYDGYAIKFEVYNGSTFVSPSNEWHMLWDSDGVPIIDYDHVISGYSWLNVRDKTVRGTNIALPFDANYTLEVGKHDYYHDYEWDEDSIYVKAYLAKVKLDDSKIHTTSAPVIDWLYTHDIILPTVHDSAAETDSLVYDRNEELLPNYQHGQDLYECTKISYYDGRLVLYGNPKTPGIIYMSDRGGNFGYFPFSAALDRFDDAVIHVHPYNEQLLVFTPTNTFIVYIDYNQNGEEIYITKLLLSNVSVHPVHTDNVLNIGKDVVFFSNSNEIRIMRPNPYVEAVNDMFVGTLSGAVDNLLKDPIKFIVRRLQYYKQSTPIFESTWKPSIEHVLHVYENQIYMYVSVEFPDRSTPYMFILLYDIDYKRWRIYDTMAMAFPYDIKVFNPLDGPYILVRNHKTLDNGVCLMLLDSLDPVSFDDGHGYLRDSKPLKIVDNTFVFNSTLTTDTEENILAVKQPINLQVDAGYIAISNHINKRFMLMQFQITNIDCVTIPTMVEFAVDGKTRQTANTVRMEQITDINDPNYGKIESVYTFEPFEADAQAKIDAGVNFQEWQLGVSRFGPLNKLRIKFGISGKGRVPSLELGFVASGMFEMYNYAIIYKEQSAR
jgi:endonuclease YncB( thermonuclease family)